MPELEDITYSREGTAAVFLDFYRFLAKMYIDDSYIMEPPVGGWPHVKTNLRGLNKTDEVLELLSILPYLKHGSNNVYNVQGAPWTNFANWAEIAAEDKHDFNALRMCSEIVTPNVVPAHMFGLAIGGRTTPIMLLDTVRGIIHWCEGPELDSDPALEEVSSEVWDYEPENFADEYLGGHSWPIPTFFEVLKDQFRKLHFIPISPQRVVDTYTTYHPDMDDALPKVLAIYHNHGWPDLERYRKEDCLQALKALSEELQL